MAKTKLLGKDKENKEKQIKASNKKQRRSISAYFKDVFAELKKVTWPTFRNLLVYTGAVIAFILIMAIITGAYDLGLATLMQMLVG